MLKPEVKELFKDRKTSALRVAREIGVTHTYMYELLGGVRRNEFRRQQIARALQVPLVDLAQICGWN
jgi:hypothetical protein